MAQALFNHHNKNSDYLGVSAGTNIASKINPVCVKVMHEIGIDMSDRSVYYPKKIDNDILNSMEMIFSMGCNIVCDLPIGKSFREDWLIDDPAAQDIDKVRIIRDQLNEKVLILINSLI